jgi:hypothetical protein
MKDNEPHPTLPPSIERSGALAALREAITLAIELPNERYAYTTCTICRGTWWGEKPGRDNPEPPRHRLDCAVPRWEAALWDAQQASQSTAPATGATPRTDAEGVDDDARWAKIQSLAWSIGKRPIEELSEVETALCGAFWRAKAAKDRNLQLERELAEVSTALEMALNRVAQLHADAEHAAPPSATAPTGWALVPVNPTAEMLEAWADAGLTVDELESLRVSYSAMLDAVPSARPETKSTGRGGGGSSN